MKTGISVIVCCFNSTRRLGPTLEHLISQTGIAHEDWEIIIVDNGSTDGTGDLANNILESGSGQRTPYKVVRETNPGLSSARRRGLDESSFKYLIYCDDDNWLASDYVATALRLIDSDPKVGVIGGFGDPVFESKEPPHFWENQFHTLAVGPQHTHEGDITDTRGVVYGAGMVVNKRAFLHLTEELGFNFLTTGRIGNQLVSGEDHELCLALRLAGYSILWSKGLRFRHFLPESRTTLEYYRRLFMGIGISSPTAMLYSSKGDSINGLKMDYRWMMLRAVKNMAKARWKLLISGYYTNADKYKYLATLQSYYMNMGIFLFVKKNRNSWKSDFFSARIFTQGRGAVGNGSPRYFC